MCSRREQRGRRGQGQDGAAEQVETEGQETRVFRRCPSTCGLPSIPLDVRPSVLNNYVRNAYCSSTTGVVQNFVCFRNGGTATQYGMIGKADQVYRSTEPVV